MIRFLILVLCVVSAAPAPSSAQSAPASGDARYHLSLVGPLPSEVEVDAWVPIADGHFFMDSIQAQQLPRGWATFVRHLSVADSVDRPLPFDTTTGASWRLNAPYRGLLHLRYAVDLGYSHGNWPTGPKQSGLLFDSTFYSVTKPFFIATNALGRGHVRFSLPRGWRISTPWDPEPNVANGFVAEDGTDLLRNTLVLGHHAEYLIRDGPLTVMLALPGRIGASAPLIEAAVRKVIHEYVALFPATPRSRLLVNFFYAPVEDAEAFRKSATLTTGDSVTPNSRVVWGNFIAHELFHHWNGQLIQGVDRDSRQFFSEGFTEYYANRTITRTGLISPELLMRRMGTHAALYSWFRWSSAFSGVSLEAAGANKTRYRFGVYQGGWTLALCLDGMIREQTHDRRSLDDFMRMMFERYGLAGRPYRTEELAAVASEMAGTDLSPFFARYVSGTDALPVGDCLRRMGFEGFGKPYAAETYVFLSETASPAEVRRRTAFIGKPIPQ